MTPKHVLAMPLGHKFGQQSIVSVISGRKVSEFGTVSPGFKSRAPDHLLRLRSYVQE